jgi:hypothetical protein
MAGAYLIQRQPLSLADGTKPDSGLDLRRLAPVDLDAVVLQALEGLLVLVVADAHDGYLGQLDARDQVGHASAIATCTRNLVSTAADGLVRECAHAILHTFPSPCFCSTPNTHLDTHLLSSACCPHHCDTIRSAVEQCRCVIHVLLNKSC